MLAFGAWLRIPHLLTEQSGVVFGASYVDVHARMPAYRLLMAAALAGAGLAVYQAFSIRFAPILWAIALYAVVAIGGSAYGGVIQRFVVGPNEQVRETPYIVNNIRATRDVMIEDANLFDATVCVLAGADFARGVCVEPDDPELARREGHIWFRGSGQRSLFPVP